jgi:hypothetical protein
MQTSRIKFVKIEGLALEVPELLSELKQLAVNHMKIRGACQEWFTSL